MERKKHRAATLGEKYNLFAPSGCVNLPAPALPKPQKKPEIKLVFQHPNLLFLQSEKQEEKNKKKLNTKPRPETSHPYEVQRSGTSTRGMPRRKTCKENSHSKTQSQEINDLMINGTASACSSSWQPVIFQKATRVNETLKTTKNCDSRAKMTVWQVLQGVDKSGERVKKWAGLMENRKHQVRLNMYSQSSKMLLKYHH